MRKARTEVAQNVDLVVSILQHLDDHEFRATMACVCKTWQACVRQSWDRVHICFDSENALVARLAWLERQLNHPLQLKSLELHSGMPSPTLEVEVANLASVCIAWNPDIISAFRLWGMQAIVWRPHP